MRADVRGDTDVVDEALAAAVERDDGFVERGFVCSEVDISHRAPCGSHVAEARDELAGL